MEEIIILDRRTFVKKGKSHINLDNQFNLNAFITRLVNTTTGVVTSWNGSFTPVAVTAGAGISIVGGVITNTSMAGGGSNTFNNGLTLAGSNVQLGGTLVQNTTIDANGTRNFSILNAATLETSGTTRIETFDGSMAYNLTASGFSAGMLMNSLVGLKLYGDDTNYRTEFSVRESSILVNHVTTGVAYTLPNNTYSPGDMIVMDNSSNLKFIDGSEILQINLNNQTALPLNQIFTIALPLCTSSYEILQWSLSCEVNTPGAITLSRSARLNSGVTNLPDMVFNLVSGTYTYESVSPTLIVLANDGGYLRFEAQALSASITNASISVRYKRKP